MDDCMNIAPNHGENDNNVPIVGTDPFPLTMTSWTSIYTNTTATNGVFDFTNTIAAPRQFFRAVGAP